jgi:hypothetical protein
MGSETAERAAPQPPRPPSSTTSLLTTWPRVRAAETDSGLNRCEPGITGRSGWPPRCEPAACLRAFDPASARPGEWGGRTIRRTRRSAAPRARKKGVMTRAPQQPAVQRRPAAAAAPRGSTGRRRRNGGSPWTVWWTTPILDKHTGSRSACGNGPERQIGVPGLRSTDYVSTIPPASEPTFPSDEQVERRVRATSAGTRPGRRTI